MWYEQEEAPAQAQWLPKEVEQIVVLARLECYSRNLPCGADALRRHLQEQGDLRPLPSRRKIGQILVLYGLTHGRTGWYEGEELDWLPVASRVPKEKRRTL
jgi:hypothetical protein